MQKSNSYGLKKVIFSTTAFFAMCSAQMAYILATAEFLNYGLINWLPVVLILVSVIALLNYVFSILLSKKLTAVGSLILSIVFLLVLAVAGLYFNADPTWHLFFVLLISRFALTIFDTSLSGFSGNYVNSRQIKNFLPFVGGMMDLATLVSSLAIFVFVWLGLYIHPLWPVIVGGVLTITGLMLIKRVFEPVNRDTEEVETGMWESVKQGMSFVFKKSRLFYLLAWLFVLFGGIIVLFVYVYNNAFAVNLDGAHLLICLAFVNFVAVLLRGIFNFKLLRPALYRIGIANLLLLYPWMMFLLSVVIMFLTENLYVVMILYVFQVFSYYSYVEVAIQSMFALVPKNLLRQVFFLLKGAFLSVSALVTSLLIWASLSVANQNPIIVTFLLFFFAAGALAVSLRIRNEYQKALLAAVVDRDIALRNNGVDLMGESVQVERGEKALRKIVKDENENVFLRQKAMTSLIEINNPNSIRELLLVLENDTNLRLRYYAIQAVNRMFEHIDKKRFGEMTVTKLLMIDVFNKVYAEDLPLPLKLEVNRALPMFGFDVLLDFYKLHFANSSDYVKASIIDALSVQEDRGLITLLEPYLNNESLEIRAAAIASLWRFPELRDQLMDNMIGLFSQKDDLHRKVSLRLISQLKLLNMEDYVLDLITLQNQEISALAVLTSINLGRKGGVQVLVRKLSKYAMQNDHEMVENVFRKLFWLSPLSKKHFVEEVRTLSASDFERLQSIYNTSDKYFDMVLAELFTI